MRDLTVLFVDLVDSTRLYERLGDEAAHAATAGVLRRWEEVVRRHRGRVVKRIGDELLCVFEETESSARAALSLMTALGEEDPCARVGLHRGAVLEERDDVFGDTVNLAARMVQAARPRQILTTEETVRSLPPIWSPCVAAWEQRAVKGKEGLRTLYEVIWEAEARTLRAPDAPAPPVRAAPILRLVLGEVELILDPGHPRARLGRQPHNDLVVPGDKVSRTHARIEQRGSSFVLSDESTNGTWVVPAHGAPRLLRRDETTLSGRGCIGLGREPRAGEPDAVHYQLGPA